MFCIKCGKELNLNETFCPKCGTRSNQQTLQPTVADEVANEATDEVANEVANEVKNDIINQVNKDVTMTKLRKAKNTNVIALIGSIAFLIVVILVGSVTFNVIKNNNKPERMVIGSWSMSGSGEGQETTTVDFTKDGKLITANDSSDHKVTYKIDSSDKKSIKLIIKDSSSDTKLNLKFIGKSKFELTKPDESSEVITFRKK